MRHRIRWTFEKISSRLELIAQFVYQQREPMGSFRYKTLAGPDAEPPIDAETDGWEQIDSNTFWGERETNFIMRGEFSFPADWDATDTAALYLPLGDAPDFIHPEALLYVDGQPYAAIDRFHQEVLLPDYWKDGGVHQLALHGFTGIWSSDMRADSSHVQLHMGEPAVVQIHQRTREFIRLARVTLETVGQLDDEHPTRWALLNALDAAFQQLDLRCPPDANFYESVSAAHDTLAGAIPTAGTPHPTEIIAAGHAHLDVAWLWTLGQTRRKAGRTFHNVMRLTEQFPTYHFTQSQPQLYDYVRQDYPELFAQIQDRVREGRWEPTGGMWVEADCNLSGGESLARQFLLGQSFFKKYFGEAATPVLWLPDVFGYAWNLPQLIKQAGLEYFFTIKIGWSQYNRLPYDSFWWQGLDGTRVLTHFSTTPEFTDTVKTVGTYNAKVSPAAALGTWRNFQQKDTQQTLFMSYGYGDGGGGPNREMLENLETLSAFPAVPRMKPGSAHEFFQRMEAESGDKLPVWDGELYLELHRGTYTSQARNKRANRKSEFLLHDAEFLATLATTLDNTFQYPAQAFHEAWELVCLNQFHDIIPGSSIREVYEESLEQYARVKALMDDSLTASQDSISEKIRGDVILVNPTSFESDSLAHWGQMLPENTRLQTADGTPILTQSIDNGTLLAAPDVPAYGTTPLHVVSDNQMVMADTGLQVTEQLLENHYVRVEFNQAGDIIRLYDKTAKRDVLPDGAHCNVFQAFEDRPMNWDAWDIDIFYDDKMWHSEPASSIRVIEAGPLRATLLIERRILNSSYQQRVTLDYNSPLLRFDTTIDWQESHILLKVAFPVDVLSPKATYEIQWGNVERPTHRNTSWDWARFESCAQKWVDLSEGDYGVSLLNDCKYGHDIHENVLRLSLLRSPRHPDRQADIGQHQFTYALLPHAGDWREGTIPAAYHLNDPLIVIDGQAGDNVSASQSWFDVDASNVVIETIKQAEDGNGIILRLYECQRKRGAACLTTGFNVQQAFETNLLEETSTELAITDGGVQLYFKPYEIKTIRLVR